MLRMLLVEAPERGKEIVRAIAESRIKEVVSTYFGAEAAEVLTPEKLTKAWADLTTSFGEWEGFTGASALVSGDYVVAETRVEFEAGAVMCRSTWSTDGKLAGLFFLPVAE